METFGGQNRVWLCDAVFSSLPTNCFQQMIWDVLGVFASYCPQLLINKHEIPTTGADLYSFSAAVWFLDDHYDLCVQLSLLHLSHNNNCKL